MSSEQPSTEEVKTSEESAQAKAPAEQEQQSAASQPAEESQPVKQEQNESAPEAASAEEAPAETVAETPAQTPAPSAEAAAPPAEAAAADSDSAAPQEDAAARPERKVQLNPKVDPAQFKAIPAAGAAPTAPAKKEEAEAEAAEEVTQEQIHEAAMMQMAEAAQPVDIPDAEDELGDDLEAELAAALSGQGAQELPKTISDEEAAAETPASAASTGSAEEGLAEGDRLKGIVESINNDDVFVDLGSRALGTPGIVPLRQFGDKKPEIGQEVDVKVTAIKESEGLIQLSLPRGHHKPSGDWDAVAVGQVVECVVNKSNKGGLEVNVGSLRGFLPASQVDLYFVGDLEPFVGQKLTVQITEVNPKKRNLVVSRRKYLESEREEIQKELWEKLAVGQELTGTVKNIKDYGAFVDLGGVDGFLHIGEISWNRIKHPKDALSEMQKVNVKILKLDQEKNRISLGMKQLLQDPWQLAEDRYATGSTVTGKVTRTTDFGAFVELEPGLEGLVHISELDHRRVKRVTEVLSTGQETSAKVLEVDPNRKRISLSLKALIDKPEAPAEAEEESQPAYERKRKGPLLGGNADDTSSGGGLFGNPDDYK